MFYKLYESIIDNCLVAGVTDSQGWGKTVEKEILPLLKHPKLDHHFDIIQGSLARFSQPISVFIVGEGKFGKSTLINALIGQGQEVAKTHFLPKTWHITRYVPTSSEERYEIYYDYQHEDTERFEILCKKCSNNSIINSGLVKLNKLSQLQEILDSEEAEKKKNATNSPIWQVLQTVPNNNFNTTMELVDTPGISQNRPGMLQEETIEDFYHRADIVLWLMIADKLNSRETNESLQSMSRYGKPIIGVINRADQIPEGKRELVINQVQDKFTGLLNDLVLVSAKQAFDAHKNDNSSLLEQSGLPILWNKIDYFAVENGRRNQAISIYNTSIKATEEARVILRQEADNIDKNLQIYQQNLKMASSFKQDNKIQTIIEGISNEAKQKIQEEGQKIMQSTSNLENESLSLFDEKLLKESLQKVINNILGKLQTFLGRELEQIQDKIRVNQYLQQSYEANGYVKSFVQQASSTIDTNQLIRDLNSANLEIDFWEEITIFLAEILGNTKDFIQNDLINNTMDFIGGLFGISFLSEEEKIQKQKEKAQREKRRIKERRQKQLLAHIHNLKNVGEKCKQEINKIAEKERETIANSLEKEVQKCFTIAFTSETTMIAKSATNRENATSAVIPNVIINKLTQVLQNK